MEEAKANLKKLFRENPSIAKAFKETLDELSKPEQVEKMSKDICSVLSKVQAIQKTKK
jgi:hypothetical protein